MPIDIREAVREGVEAGRTDDQIAEDTGRPRAEISKVRREMKLQAQRAKKTDGPDARLDLRLYSRELAILDAHCERTGDTRTDAIRAWIRTLG